MNATMIRVQMEPRALMPSIRTLVIVPQGTEEHTARQVGATY